MITLELDTYVTVEEAEAYAEANGLELPTGDELERILKQATKLTDRKWGNRFMGYKSEAEQPLAWPRLVTNVMAYKGVVWNYTMDADGNPRNFNGIQPELKEAVVELAAMINADPTVVYAQPQPIITSESAKLDVLDTTVSYQNGYQVDPFYKIKMILRPILNVPQGLKISRGA